MVLPPCPIEMKPLIRLGTAPTLAICDLAPLPYHAVVLLHL